MIGQIIANTLITGSIYALIAISFDLLYSTTRFFNLAMGVMLAVGGYMFFLLTNIIGVNSILAACLAVLFTGIFGLLSEKLIYKRLRNNGSTAMVMMVASIGLMVVVQSVLSILFGSRFKILGLEYDFSTYTIFGVRITFVQILIIGFLFIFVLVLGIVLKKTRYGKQIRAVGDNPELAKAVGIDTNKVIAVVFFVACSLAGMIGIFIGLDSGIEPLMGFSWLIKGVVAAIIGTIGYWYGGILGAFLLAFIEQVVVWQFSGEWKDVVSFIVLIMFLIVRPNGLFGKKT